MNSSKIKNKVVLCILDGLGLNPNPYGNAVLQAKTPILDKLFKEYPSSTLTTFGEQVGLPHGQMGNSEVGHLNIGAGRVVLQWLLKIDKGLEKENLNLIKSFQDFKKYNLTQNNIIHLVGLLSDGGVHSHIDHLLKLITRLEESLTNQICIHIITDGRDTSPQKSQEYIQKLQNFIANKTNIQIVSLCGRFFAMDRDKRWERTKEFYDLIVTGSVIKDGKRVRNSFKDISKLSSYIQDSYSKGITDEFLEPISSEKYTGVKANDSILFWNFRADRMRQIVSSLCCDKFEGFNRIIGKENNEVNSHSIPAFRIQNTLQFTNYDPNMGLPYLFEAEIIKNHLGEVIANQGLTQLRVAETEKYAHVTYFFNGGNETPCIKEERILVPSPKDVKTYDLKPEMSAEIITDKIISAISSQKQDLIVINYANCDMVGHTGNLSATIKAVETVDTCLGKIINQLNVYNSNSTNEIKFVLVVIADHGNAELKINYDDETPHTSHTTYPVPIIIYGENKNFTISEGALCDVSPTILEIMGVEKPEEMTGKSLINISSN